MSSSDEEIIGRATTRKPSPDIQPERSKKLRSSQNNYKLSQLFENNAEEEQSSEYIKSTESSSVNEGHVNHEFNILKSKIQAIFGDGTEYLHLINKQNLPKNKTDKDEVNAEKLERFRNIRKNKKNSRYTQESNEDELIDNCINLYNTDSTTVKLLNKKYPPEYIALFHNKNKTSFYDIYQLNEYIIRFNRFLKIKNVCQNKLPSENLFKYKTYEELEDILQYNPKKMITNVEYENYKKIALEPDQLIKNIIHEECIHIVDKITKENEYLLEKSNYETFFDVYAKKLVLHPAYKKLIRIQYKKYIEEMSSSYQNEYGEIQNKISFKEYICKILLKYLRNDNTDEYDFFYKKLTEVIFTETKERVYKLEVEKKGLYNEMFYYIYNSTYYRPISGCKYIVLVLLEKFTLAKIYDYKLNEIKRINIEIDNMAMYAEEFKQCNPACIAIYSDLHICKKIFSFLEECVPDTNIFFVDCKFIDIKNSSDIHHDIISSLTVPELFYLKNINYIMNRQQKKYKSLTNMESRDMIKKAILTSLSIKGMDLNYVIRDKNLHVIFDLLDMSEIKEIIYEKNVIYTLKSLKPKFKNLLMSDKRFFSFFRIYSDTFKVSSRNRKNFIHLDSLPLHPNVYNKTVSTLKKHFSGFFGTKNNEITDEESDYKELEKILKLYKDQIVNYFQTSQDLTYIEKAIGYFLYYTPPMFQGIDNKRFCKIILPFGKSNLNRPFIGVVKNIFKSTVQVQIEVKNRKFTIFCDKIDNIVLDELVTVVVRKISEKFFSLQGDIYKREDMGKIRSHRRFKNISIQKAKKLLLSNDFIKNKVNFLITYDTAYNMVYFVCRLIEKSFRVIEINRLELFIVEDETYENVDSFINNYIKDMFKRVKEVVSHENYSKKRNITSNKNDVWYFEEDKLIIQNNAHKLKIRVGNVFILDERKFGNTHELIDYIKQNYQ